MHLTSERESAQHAVFDWALREILRAAPDAVACLGDATACGDADTALHARARLEALRLPLLLTPGNADARRPEEWTRTARLLTARVDARLGGWRLACVEAPDGSLSAGERARLEALPHDERLLVFSHIAPEDLAEDARAFLRAWARGREVGFWAAGHAHGERLGDFCGAPSWKLRALDPDKCIGGPPALYLFEEENGVWRVRRREFMGGVPSAWTRAEREELAGYLGITCRDAPAGLRFAQAEGVRHLELRHPGEASGELRGAVAAWRAAQPAGASTLSVHLPAPGHAAMAEYVRSAVALGAQFVTLHPPSLRVGEAEGERFEAAADECADSLRPLARAGTRILVENMHTLAPCARTERPFGCEPAEVLIWLYALEARLGQGACAMRLDIGHARNNAPLSQRYTLGAWYAQVGALCASYHVHQVGQEPDGALRNHLPLMDLHQSLIALDGFLWAWRAGQLTHGPLILETRSDEGARASFRALKAAILGATEVASCE